MKAIKPDKFFTNIQSLVGEKRAEKAGLTEEERVLYSGSKTAFWKTLKGYIEDLTNELDKVNESAIETGASLEDIGRNTIVVSLAKGIIKKLVNKVEDAKEACEDKK